MRTQEMTTVEYSEPVVASLIEDHAETGWEGVAAAHLVGEFAVPSRVLDPRGQATQLIVIAGGAASGKSTLALEMSRAMAGGGTTSAVISTDDFVRGDRGARRAWELSGISPAEKYDFAALSQAIGVICANQDPTRTVAVPQYDSRTGLAVDGKARKSIPRVDVLIVEGDMLGEQGVAPQDLYLDWAYDPFSVYVHASDGERLRRRVARDMRDRNGHGETPQVIVDSFERRQQAQHLPHTLTYASMADILVAPPANPGYDGRAYDMYTF